VTGSVAANDGGQTKVAAMTTAIKVRMVLGRMLESPSAAEAVGRAPDVRLGGARPHASNPSIACG
jgi:hypothetical protein